MRAKQRLKIFCFNIMSLAAAFLFSAVVMEAALRLIKPVTKIYYPAGKTFEAVYTADDDYVYGLKPGVVCRHYSYYGDFVATYRVNSEGLRASRDYGREKPAGTKRIFLLGDSYAFGRGVDNDQTCAAALEEKLNKSGKRYEVLNSGTIGYSTDNEYVYLKRKALLFDPDIVVLMLFPRNDIMDMRQHDWITDKAGLPERILDRCYAVDKFGYLINVIKGERSLNVSPLKKFLRDNSYIYTFLSEHRYFLKYEWTWLKAFFKKSAAGNAKLKEETRMFNIEKATDEEKRMLERERVLLIGMKEELERKKKRFLVVLIPDSEYDKYMKDFIRANGIEMVDIGYHMKDDGVKDLYLPKDMHWSKFGNSYIANLIYRRVVDEKD